MTATCEYCSRSLYFNGGANCKGCGAPITAEQVDTFLRTVMTPAIMYDSQALSAETQAQLGQPRTTIPIHTQVISSAAVIAGILFRV